MKKLIIIGLMMMAMAGNLWPGDDYPNLIYKIPIADYCMCRPDSCFCTGECQSDGYVYFSTFDLMYLFKADCETAKEEAKKRVDKIIKERQARP